MRSDFLGPLTFGIDLDETRNIRSRQLEGKLLIERGDLLARATPVCVDCVLFVSDSYHQTARDGQNKNGI
jgi:hypothetical protein